MAFDETRGKGKKRNRWNKAIKPGRDLNNLRERRLDMRLPLVSVDLFNGFVPG